MAPKQMKSKKQHFQVCDECLILGKKKLISKSNFRKHLRRIHLAVSEPRNIQQQNRTKCEGCFNQYSKRSIRKHERVCPRFIEIYGRLSKSRKKIAYFFSKKPEDRRFLLRPLEKDRSFPEVFLNFDLDVRGKKVQGIMIPKYNKDNNHKTISFAQPQSLRQVDSSFQEPIRDKSFEECQDVKPCPVKAKKSQSYCQNCNLAFSSEDMRNHCNSDNHLFQITTRPINIGINQLVQKFQFKGKKSDKNIVSESYIICDDNLRTLACRNQKKLFNIASLTKLLNLLVCLDIVDQFCLNVESQYVIPKFNVKRSETKACLIEGEKMSLQSLFLAMLIPSGNDAAQSLSIILGKILSQASHLRGDNQMYRSLFIERMKKKAKDIGMNATIINEEKGFGYNKSTAEQVAILLKEVSYNQYILQLLSKQVVTINAIDKQNRPIRHCWTNTNRLVSQGFIGKTGSAIDQTFSLATIKKLNGTIFFICVLGCFSESGRFSDTKQLFSSYSKIIHDSIQPQHTISQQGPIPDKKQSVDFIPDKPEGRLVCHLQRYEYPTLDRYFCLLEEVKFPKNVQKFLKQCEVCGEWCNTEYIEEACSARIHKLCKDKMNKNCYCRDKFPQPADEPADCYDGKFKNKKLLTSSSLDLRIMPDELNLDLEEQFRMRLKQRGISYVRNCRYYGELQTSLDFRTDPFVQTISKMTKKSYQKYLSEQYFPPIIPKFIPGKQLGVVAVKIIPKGTLVCEYAGDVVPAVYAKLNPEYSMGNYEGKRVSETSIITVYKFSSVGPLINHSKKNPNCRTIRIFEPSIINFPIVLLYSIKDIQVGEQLVYNYNGEENRYPTQNFI